jgi:hypothetical protein
MERQFTLLAPSGEFVARFDFAVVDAQLGIEYHSDQWHYGPRRGRGDRRRDFAASQLDWDIMYLDSADHRSPASAVAAVAATVATRRSRLALLG